MSINISYGATAPSIYKQIKDLDLRFDKETLDSFDDDAAAISRLYVRGLITETMMVKARQRLTQHIREYLKTANNPSLIS